MCRQPVKKKELTRDLLGFQIINDLEIFCNNTGCQWQGELQELPRHIQNQCTYKGGNLPQWYKDYLKSKQEEEEIQYTKNENLDPNLQEVLNQNKEVSLAMRLFKHGDNNNNNCLRRALGNEASEIRKSIVEEEK